MSIRCRVVETASADGQPIWTICAVTHADDGSPVSYNVNPVIVGTMPGDTFDGLRVQLDDMLAALDEPIVRGGDLTVDGEMG
jgi:hypothetical protein